MFRTTVKDLLTCQSTTVVKQGLNIAGYVPLLQENNCPVETFGKASLYLTDLLDINIQ